MKAENTEFVSNFAMHPLTFYFLGMLFGSVLTLLIVLFLS